LDQFKSTWGFWTNEVSARVLRFPVVVNLLTGVLMAQQEITEDFKLIAGQ
jgi:hypothetical protein